MRKTVLICAALALTARAQDAGAASDALYWAAGLREPMRRMGDPVVTTYGIASLAAVLCPVDKGIGSDLYREAILGLNNLSDNIFQDSTKVLPVATFSGLWKLVVGPGMKCDSTLPQPSDHAREKRDSERRQAANFLAQAKFTDDYNRAAQLAQAALEAGDPYQLDASSISSFLIEFRVPAPDLADDIFQRAIAFTTSAELTNVSALAELGNYLFVGVGLQGKSEPLLNRVTYTVNGSPFVSWAGDHENANPDMVAAYVRAVADMLSKQEISATDLVAAYAMVYQLLPRAHDLELSEADTLQKAADQMMDQNAGVASAVAAKLSGNTGQGPGQANFGRLMAQIRAALAARRFSQARDLLKEVDGVALRSEIATVIDFHEAAAAIHAKDSKDSNSDRAVELASALPAGVKRALVYAGIVGTAADRLTAIPALHMGLKDAELLSYEQRMALLPALAAACIGVDANETLAVLSQLIAAHNNAAVRSRKVPFDPRNSNPFDGPRVLIGAAGFAEVVQGNQRQQTFALKVPGVSAYSLETFIAQAKDMDFPSLAATVEELRNEIQLTRAYLALARLRLKEAKLGKVDR